MTYEITQAEADALFALAKRRVDAQPIRFPDPGAKVTAELVSLDEREKFLLDINRSSVSISKITYQNRARVIVILARLDLGGAPHRNPDDTEMDCPHLHLYREGYGDKWAFPLPPEVFSNVENLWQALQDFMRYCNIVEPPLFERNLLS
jgi:hypothetical protein